MQRQRLHNARESVIIKFVLSLHRSEVQNKGVLLEKKKYGKLLNKESTSNKKKSKLNQRGQKINLK